MVNIAVKETANAAKEKNISMHVNIPDNIDILFDRDGFEQIIFEQLQECRQVYP